jgi:hypothetical protein
MSGTVFLTKDNVWSAGSSPFRWAMEFLALTFKGNIYIFAVVKAIDEENIGQIDLDEFTPDNRHLILEALSTKLVPDARERLPKNMEYRDKYISFLQELADMATQILERK